MKVYDNSVNTIQDRTFTYERKIAYRNGDPYIISSELHDPQLVFSLGSSKFVKEKKFYKEFWGAVDGTYPRFYQTTPEVITEEPVDKSVYFDGEELQSRCVFKYTGNSDSIPPYFYYTREAVIAKALDMPEVWRSYWTDGENHYLSIDTSFDYEDDEDHYEHYVLDENGAWVPKVWNGYTTFTRYNIWNYKGKTYCSDGTEQFVLNKSTSTWEVKVWNSLPQDGFSGNELLVDEVENKVYLFTYFNFNSRYVLDEDTDTWEVMDWGEINPNPTYGFWHQGENYYGGRLISVNGQREFQSLMLNRTLHTWEEKIWNVPSDLMIPLGIRADNIWHKGESCYYSDSFGNNFVLDENTDTWSEKIWNGLPMYRFDGSPLVNNTTGEPYFNADSIWDWNGKIYYSGNGGAVQYVLNDETDTWEPYRWPTTYISGYTYTEVPYEFTYKLDFPYDITREFQGINYVYDLKLVAGISNYEYLVNLLHVYQVDEETFTIRIGSNSYEFGWDSITEKWLVNGEQPSFVLLLAFAKSYEVKSYIGKDKVNTYLEELKRCTIQEPITEPDYVEYILKPTAFNVMSRVKGPLKEG